ncbi:MAG TPA: hypothetical protein VF609_12835 [Flavisolibacter sp.]
MKIRNLLHLLTFLCFVASFTSCKKEEEPAKEPETPVSVLNSKDPQAISAAVKVWHGERVQGTAPAPKGSAVGLDASSSEPFTIAFKGRYAIIEPSVAQGNIAGYYLQFNGAKEYFKIDYSKPRGGRLAARRPSSPFGNGSRQSRTLNGNEDSAIVIALPANLQVPDTFCVSYCAYDPSGNVSNVINTCIIVNSLDTDAAGSFLHGTWKSTATWDSTVQHRDTIIYNTWLPAPYHTGYACQADPNTGNSVLSFNMNAGTTLVSDSMFYLKSHIRFGTNGGMSYEYQSKAKEVDLAASNCSQYIFSVPTEDNQTISGAWNYNAASGKMVLVFEFDDAGVPSLEAWEYRVIKVTDNNIVLAEDLAGYPYYVRFEK